MQDMHNELQDVMGQSFGVPDDIDEVVNHSHILPTLQGHDFLACRGGQSLSCPKLSPYHVNLYSMMLKAASWQALVWSQGELMGELDALEDELAQEAEHHEAGGVPSYLQVLLHCCGLHAVIFIIA